MADILVVDDDQSVAAAFEQFLSFEGHDQRLASNAEDALRLIRERPPAVVMLDVRMPGVDGLQALEEIRREFPDVLVVIMTAHGTSQTSIDAIRAGAFDYLTKPLDLDEIRGVIRKALAARLTRQSAEGVEVEAERTPRLVGNTPAMLDVYKMIGRLAAIDVPALLTGEESAGKELVAATIHDNSSRRDQRFVSIDCATASSETIESELFGRAKGTLYLANVEALPSALQVRLAGALADDRPRQAGDTRLGVRVMASSTADLTELTESDAFNRDLHAAIAIVTMTLPPLRARRDDIPLLARHFIQRFNVQFERTITGWEDGVQERLQEYPWPGNVGELERVIKRGCILARSDVITDDDIRESLNRRRLPGRRDVESALTQAARTALQERLVDASASSSASVYHDIIDMVETALVQEALVVTHGNQVRASTILGVNRATLRKKMPAGS